MRRWLRSDPVGHLYVAVCLAVWVAVFAVWSAGGHG